MVPIHSDVCSCELNLKTRQIAISQTVWRDTYGWMHDFLCSFDDWQIQLQSFSQFDATDHVEVSGICDNRTSR